MHCSFELCSLALGLSENITHAILSNHVENVYVYVKKMLMILLFESMSIVISLLNKHEVDLNFTSFIYERLAGIESHKQ